MQNRAQSWAQSRAARSRDRDAGGTHETDDIIDRALGTGRERESDSAFAWAGTAREPLGGPLSGVPARSLVAASGSDGDLPRFVSATSGPPVGASSPDWPSDFTTARSGQRQSGAEFPREAHALRATGRALTLDESLQYEAGVERVERVGEAGWRGRLCPPFTHPDGPRSRHSPQAAPNGGPGGPSLPGGSAALAEGVAAMGPGRRSGDAGAEPGTARQPRARAVLARTDTTDAVHFRNLFAHYGDLQAGRIAAGAAPPGTVREEADEGGDGDGADGGAPPLGRRRSLSEMVSAAERTANGHGNGNGNGSGDGGAGTIDGTPGFSGASSEEPRPGQGSDRQSGGAGGSDRDRSTPKEMSIRTLLWDFGHAIGLSVRRNADGATQSGEAGEPPPSSQGQGRALAGEEEDSQRWRRNGLPMGRLLSMQSSPVTVQRRMSLDLDG